MVYIGHCAVGGVVIDRTGVYNFCTMKYEWRLECESNSRWRDMYEYAFNTLFVSCDTLSLSEFRGKYPPQKARFSFFTLYFVPGAYSWHVVHSSIDSLSVDGRCETNVLQECKRLVSNFEYMSCIQ